MTPIVKQQEQHDLERANSFIQKFESTINNEGADCSKESDLVTGVDLGTANIVLSVVDFRGEPVAGAMEAAQVVRDGLVVDYMGAIGIVRDLKGKLERRLGLELTRAATGIPPGTGWADARGIVNVVDSAGLEVVEIIDEPSAAVKVLAIDEGVVVDVGGGTTGISVVKQGEVVYTADEATGGIHFTYVIAGNYGISIAEAEELKQNAGSREMVAPILIPSIEKVASIIEKHLHYLSHNPEVIYLVGGSCCFPTFSQIVERCLGVKTLRPYNPLLITPLGIALSGIPGEEKVRMQDDYLY